tara:strand:- start:472 stop:1068 length:597 start_codon:yes stop_codon:yes gene_type:complete
MIEFKTLYQETPYLIFKKKYDEALDADQKNIEAIAISSYNKENNEVDSRFVNLKFVDDNKFIFFSNYNSPKSTAFSSHNQISALLYWPSINFQIRMKAKINKTPKEYNNEYFKKRSIDKNALAISSNQSAPIKSYEDVKKNYFDSLNSDYLSDCPDYWGGYSFIPYYFEFWEGHDSRLNKRDIHEMIHNEWHHYILQP